MIRITEKVIQTLLLDYTMQHSAHRVALPNVTDGGSPRVAPWEMDMLSVNRSGFSNEYEIKLNRTDYLRDRLKVMKQSRLLSTYDFSRKNKGFMLYDDTPNYFWYVTCGFEIVPPEYAGWMVVEKGESRTREYLTLRIIKRAPRLHAGGVGDERLITMGRLLSYRLSHAYRALYKSSGPKEIQPVAGELDSPHHSL